MVDKMRQKEQEDDFKHPDSCWSWIVCAASFISLTIVLGYSISWGILLPAVMDYFNETRASTALVGSLGNGFGYGISPLVSVLCDHFGFRTIAVVGTVMIAAGLVLSSLVSNLSLLFFTYSATVGAGYAFVYFANVMAVTKYFIRRRSIAVGIITSGACSGMLLVSQSNTVLLEHFGLKKTLRAMAISMVVPLCCSITFNPSVSSGEMKYKPGSSEKKPKKASCFGMISVLRNKLFTLYTVSFSIVFMAYYVLPIHIVKYGDELGIARHEMANLYIYLAISQFFSRLLFSYVSSCEAVNIFYLYQTAAGACGIIYTVVPLASTLSHLLLIIVFFGLMDGGLYGICILIVAHCVDAEELPQAIGIFSTAAMFSCTGPLLAGLVADERGSYAVAFYASGVVILLGASLMFFKNCVQPVNKEPNCFTHTIVLVVERETVL